MEAQEVFSDIQNYSPTAGIETPVIEAVEEKPETPVFTPDKQKDEFLDRFTKLSAKERQLVQQRSELAKQKEALDIYNKLKSSKNPREIMSHFGVEFSNILEDNLKGVDENSEIEQLKREFNALKLERQQQQEQLQAKEQEQTYFKAIETISNFVKDNDDYEYINAYGQQQTVFDFIKNHYDATQEALSLEAAAKQVEKTLEDIVEKVKQTKKFQKYLGNNGQGSQQQSESKTITNKSVASQAPFFPKTDEELRNLAIATLQGGS